MEKRLRPGALPQTPRLAAGLFFLSFSPREGEKREERRSSEREKREGEEMGKERRKKRREEVEKGKREGEPLTPAARYGV